MLRPAIDHDGPADAPPPTATGRLAPLVLLLGPRGARAAVVALVVLGLSLLIVSGLPGRLGAWVHDRPEYAWTIDRIELDPAPPAWIRAGRRELLAGVAPHLEPFDGGSALDLDLAAVERAFKNLFWVERVRAVRHRYPARIVVSLDYRRPVALAELPPADSGSPPRPAEVLILDADALILDRLPIGSDLARSCAAELVSLSGLDLPTELAVGRPWARPESPDDPGPTPPDPTALAASRLAAFLLDRSSRDGWPETRSGQLIPFRRVHPFNADPRKLYINHVLPDGQVLWVVWESAPGSERPDEPTADDKWQMLRNWIASGGIDRPLEPGALGFTPRGPVWLPPL